MTIVHDHASGERTVRWTGDNFADLNAILGKRGDYVVDPYYLRKLPTEKIMFWNSVSKKWERVTYGDTFTIDKDGDVWRNLDL